MKQMQRDPLSRQKALRAERRADEKSGAHVITIKPLQLSGKPASSAAALEGGGGGGAGFKKGGFRNAFADVDTDSGGGPREEEGGDGGDADAGGMRGAEEGARDGDGDGEGRVGSEEKSESESESGGEDGDRYDPRRPTGCWEGCPGR